MNEKGIPLIRGWTDHDLPSLHELMQIIMEQFDSQAKWPVRMKTIFRRESRKQPTTSQPGFLFGGPPGRYHPVDFA